MNKQIVQVLAGIPTQDGAGVSLTRIVGQPRLKNIDPFLMLDEFASDDPNDYIAGFPPHPHKGFETLTYMLHGSMEHNDSTGGHGLITTGGVQYMTAGKGIIHSETPKQQQGLMWGFQLWINLPAKDKLTPAKYVDIPEEKIPLVQLSEHTKVKLIAGQLDGSHAIGPVVRQDINMQIYDVMTSSAEQIEVNLDEHSQGYIYVYQGTLEVNGNSIKEKQVAQLGKGKGLSLSVKDNSGFLLVAGTPINEPIVQYGPFVMNSMEEIDQAIRDYQSGQLVAYMNK